jgi:histidyl-tRNA synthetase
MGGKAMPACGFGCGDVVLGLLLEERGLRPEAEPLADCFVLSQQPNWAQVIAAVRLFRNLGLRTQYDLKGGRFKRQHEKALESGARFKVILGEEPWPKARIIDTRADASGIMPSRVVELAPEDPSTIEVLKKFFCLAGG